MSSTGRSQLEEQAHVIADKLVLGFAVDPDDAIQLGVDLLVAGEDGPAVLELASMSPGSRWIDVEEPARAALAEIGVVLPLVAAAAWDLARFWATQLEHGGSDAISRARCIYGLWWTLDTPREVGALIPLLDAWEETLPGDSRRHEIEVGLAGLARPIIDAAEHAQSESL